MEKELDLYTATLDEIVFEDRNKAYGGYFLRVWYEKNVTKAVIFTCAAFVVVAAGINLYYNITAKPVEVYVPIVIDMEPLDELKPEEKEKLPPPPPKVEQPKIEEMKFMPPIIKPDKLVAKEEQMKELDSLLTSKISTQNVDGEKTPKYDFDEPEEGGQIGGTGEKTPEIYTYAEVMPLFKGTSTQDESNKAFQNFVKGRTMFPEDAKRAGAKGVVWIQYVVTTTGKVTNVEVVKGKGIHPSCDAEAVRVIKSLPDFSPPLQNGVPRSIKVFTKVNFTLI